MLRASRYTPGGMLFHVLNRGVGRRTLFEKDADYCAFERVIEETLRTRPMRIGAYCLMPNHWRFVLWPQSDGDLIGVLIVLLPSGQTRRYTSTWEVRLMSRRVSNITRSAIQFLCATLALSFAINAQATVIVNDSWADGGRDNGADPLDSNWWTSASSLGIEVFVGSLGMVTGSSGRGIHTIFPTQTLANVGDKLVATYTFTTPATVGRTTGTSVFRVGLFDTLGRAGLDADVSSSSGSPNDLYGYFNTPTDALPGYMMDMDIGTGAEDLSFRQHDTVPTGSTPTGLLMGTTSGFTSLSPTGPDGVYTIDPNTTYTGSLALKRISATELELTGTFGTETHSATDEFDSASYGMFAFWANSNIFGVSNVPGEDNNGIDFSNVTIEFIAIPEPASLMLLSMAGMFGAMRRSRK